MSVEPDHDVVIIGAGLGGLGTAIALRRAGITELTIVERAGDIGGTWRDNTYPGVGVDVPAAAYQFSYDLNPNWSRTFVGGAEVKAYIDRLADQHDLRPLVRFGTEVVRRRWDEANHRWVLETEGPDGPGQVTARFVVSAIGALVDPKPPGLTGLDDFGGVVLHTARWDHGHSLAQKRVAVIGTGASAVQVVPTIAPTVAHLDVYQRTPIWVAPKLDLPVPNPLRSLLRRAPVAQRAAKQATTAATELLLVGLVLGHERRPWVTRSASNALRRFWYRSQVRDREVRAALTPTYGLGCKRPSVSNDYLRTFNRSDVTLVTDPIDRITSTGIRTASGQERAVDAIVLATGFRLASDPECYRRTPVQGRDGFDLATSYEEHRLSSYEGVSQPGLPNHFTIFGPYGWTGGTWHQLVETASAHIARVLSEARRRGATAVEVTPEATDAWTAEMRTRMSRSLFQSPSCAGSHSYYVDHHGDTPYLRPTSSKQAVTASRTFPLDHYRFEHLEQS